MIDCAVAGDGDPPGPAGGDTHYNHLRNMKAPKTAVCCIAILLSVGALSARAQTPPPSKPQPVPSIDGGLGSCSLELTITTPDGKPVDAADVKVHISYGFGGFHKLDLEAGTNSDGKVKFTGLPSRVHRPPLEFRATKDQLSGIATYDPAAECQAHHDIVLQRQPEQPEP